MRNCFVPGCDIYCRTHNCVQRKMFFAPKEMFEKWKELLPNKREFKKNDRVCERHFQEDQIIQFWENTINGKIHKTKREKPKLLATAIPTVNLPNQLISPVQQKKQLEKIKNLHTQIIKRASKDEPNSNEKEQNHSPAKKLKVAQDVAIINHHQREIIKKSIPDKQNDEDVLEIFENLYDEVHDVTLPNTLFGINRCPDRTFIVFNEFNFKIMGFNKYLFIDNSLNCKIYINGNVTTEKLSKENCNTEFISDWLDRINEM